MSSLLRARLGIASRILIATVLATIASDLAFQRSATAAIHALARINTGGNSLGENFAIASRESETDAPPIFDHVIGTAIAAGDPGASTWNLRGYAYAAANHFIGTSITATATWLDSVTVTSPTAGAVTLRFYFQVEGHLDWALNGPVPSAVLLSNSTTIFTWDVNDQAANIVYEATFHPSWDFANGFSIDQRSSYGGPGFDAFGIGGYFVGTGYYDVGIDLDRQDDHGLWFGTTPYTIQFQTSAGAAGNPDHPLIWGSSDFLHTARLTSVVFAGTDVTPESAGYSLSFDSGLVSPNLQTETTPEPGSLLAWAGFAFLRLVARVRFAIRNRRIFQVAGALFFLGIVAPADAAIVSYQFSGVVTSSSFSPYSVTAPTTIQGTLVYDTATPDSTAYGFPTDQQIYEGIYNYFHPTSPPGYPSGPYGMTLTTNTGLSFQTDRVSPPSNGLRELDLSIDVIPRQLFAGNPSFRDTISIDSRNVLLPNGWSSTRNDGGIRSSLNITITGSPGNTLLNGSDNLPALLPGPSDSRVAQWTFSVRVSSWVLAPGGSGSGTALFGGVITEIHHVVTSDTQVIAASPSYSTTVGGGSSAVGGINVTIPTPTGGSFSSAYSFLNPNDLPLTGPFSAASFSLGVPGQALQYWDLGFTGALSGPATLTFGFDPTLVPNIGDVGIWHFNSANTWEFLGGQIAGNTITFQTDSFSPFALALRPGASPPTATTPEPPTLVMFAATLLGAGAHGVRRRRVWTSAFRSRHTL